MLVGDQDLRLAAGDDVLQFLLFGLWIDHHKRRARPECGPNADHAFQSIVRVDHNPVAAPDSALHQGGGTTPDMIEELCIGHPFGFRNQRGFVRTVMGRGDQAVMQEALEAGLGGGLHGGHGFRAVGHPQEAGISPGAAASSGFSRLITRAGTPATRELGGTEWVSAAPAEITLPAPITVPGEMMARAPIHTPSSTTIGAPIVLPARFRAGPISCVLVMKVAWKAMETLLPMVILS